ncbi:MAG: hypothetical protein LLG02_16290 [Pelosinus sp.]|nr:hypothetical protein [Pelosinus sp.]
MLFIISSLYLIKSSISPLTTAAI